MTLKVCAHRKTGMMPLLRGFARVQLVRGVSGITVIQELF